MFPRAHSECGPAPARESNLTDTRYNERSISWRSHDSIVLHIRTAQCWIRCRHPPTQWQCIFRLLESLRLFQRLFNNSVPKVQTINDGRVVRGVTLSARHRGRDGQIKGKGSGVMNKPSSRALAALLSAFLLMGAAHAQQPMQKLHSHVRPVVATGQAILMGELPSTQRMNLAIMRPLRNQAELTALLGRQRDPASADYHKYLSVAQFTAQFSPTEQDYQQVVEFAKANGLTVTRTPANRLIVDIS